jgi:hypothetical protein
MAHFCPTVVHIALPQQPLEIVPRFSSRYGPRTRPRFLKNESVHSQPCLGVCIVQCDPATLGVPTLGSYGPEGRRRAA